MKEFILEKLYKIIKYSKAITSISTISLTFLITWAILLSYGLNANITFTKSNEYIPFIVFIVLFFALYISCFLCSLTLYLRHVKGSSKIIYYRYKIIVIAVMIIPFGLSFVLFLWTRQLINDIQQDLIEV